jgi:hypothetical protein
MCNGSIVPREGLKRMNCLEVKQLSIYRRGRPVAVYFLFEFRFAMRHARWARKCQIQVICPTLCPFNFDVMVTSFFKVELDFFFVSGVQR